MRGNGQIGSNKCVQRHKSRLGGHIISTKQIETVQFIAWNQPFDLIQNSQRIEGTEFWFKVIRGQPHRVAVCFAGLCAARLAQVTRYAAFAEGDEGFHIDAHTAGEPHQNLKVGFHSWAISRLSDELNISVGVGDGARLLIKAGGREHDICLCRGVGEKDILHNDKRMLECGGIEVVAGRRIGTDDEQRT